MYKVVGGSDLRAEGAFYPVIKDPDYFTLVKLQSLGRTLEFTPIQAASVVLGRDITAKEMKDFILM